MKNRVKGSAISACACGDHLFFPITRGFVALISQEDRHLAADRRWQVNVSGKVAYARRGRPHQQWLHREVMKPDVGVFIDHVNGNGLDNRRSNLRLADKCENAWNRGQRADSTTPYKGVSRCKSKVRPWRAMIAIDGKQTHLGTFATAEEAHAAYAAAASHAHGQFARLS